MITRISMRELLDEYLGEWPGPGGLLPDRWTVTLQAGEIPEVRCLVPVLDPTISGGTALEDTIVFEGEDDDD